MLLSNPDKSWWNFAKLKRADFTNQYVEKVLFIGSSKYAKLAFFSLPFLIALFSGLIHLGCMMSGKLILMEKICLYWKYFHLNKILMKNF